MSALLLLTIPPVGLAIYRVLAARHVSAGPAVAAAAVVAIVVAGGPAWALRTKASHGQPLETPVGPAFASTTGRVELLVDYESGWSAPSQVHGSTVRRLSGRGLLAVGPLEATRPHATLSFDASATKPTRLTVVLSGHTIRTIHITAAPRHFSIAVPQGTGPAVYEFDVAPRGTIVVPVSSVHAAVAA